MVEKYVREESMIRGPKFVVRLRSHTVFENTPIKLFCTVEGFPTPTVQWSVVSLFTIQYEICFFKSMYMGFVLNMDPFVMENVIRSRISSMYHSRYA